MGLKRRARIDAILEEALLREPASRAAFVADVCGEDEELFREVSSLLDGHARAGAFLEVPALADPELRAVVDDALGTESGEAGPTFACGEIVAERFEVRRLRGRGGMGEIFEAYDRELGELVALKTVAPAIASSEQARTRIKEEIRLARRVTHPNVCRMYDVCHHVTHSGTREVTVLSMELLTGRTLADRLRTEGPMDWRQALPILQQIALGLQAAHDSGIVHRDLKPTNVMLLEGERAVITDFGLARLGDDTDVFDGAGARSRDDAVTAPLESSRDVDSKRSGAVWGTPGYMAPEQLRGERTDRAADLFSLGIIAYEMLTGELPYVASSGDATLVSKFATAPRPLRSSKPAIPRKLERLVMRCLEPERKHRGPSASDFARSVASIYRRPLRERRWKAVAAAILVGGLCLIPTHRMKRLEIASFAVSEQARAAFERGMESLRNGENLAAAGYFERATAHEPEFLLAHVKLVESLLNSGNQIDADAAVEPIASLRDRPAGGSGEQKLAEAVIARSRLDYHRAYELYSALAEEFPLDRDVGLTRARSLEDTGDIPEATRQYEALLDSRPSAASLLGLGRSLIRLGRIDETLTLLSNPANHALTAGHQEAQGMFHSIVGVGHRRSGRIDRARSHLQRSLEFRRRAGDLRGQATTLTNLAQVAETQGRYRDSEALLRQSLYITRRIGDKTIESFALVNLGEVFLSVGRLHDGLETFRESLDIELNRNEPMELGHRMHSMARANLLLGNFEDAAVFVNQAESYSTHAGDGDLRAKSFTLLGRIQLAQSKIDAARDSFASSDQISAELGLVVRRVQNKLELSRLHALTGDHTEAHRAIEDGATRSRTVEYEYGMGLSRLHLARHLMDTGNVDDASANLEGDFNDKAFTKENQLELTLVKARLGSLRGSPTTQLNQLRSVADEARERGYFEIGLTADIRVAEALIAREEHDAAERALLQVIEASKRARAKKPHAEASLMMAELEALKKSFHQAETRAREAIVLAAAFEGRPILVRAHAVLALVLDAKGDAAGAAGARAESRRLRLWIAEHTLPVHAAAEQ